MKNILRKLPKIELHCHLDGSVRPKTMYELLQHEDEEIEKMGFGKFKKLIRVEKDCPSLNDYLKKFSYPLKVMQNRENIERITYELMEDLSRQNVKYVEIRFAPFLSMEGGLNFDEVVESVLEGMNRGKKDFGIRANGILISMRHDEEEKSLEVVKQGEKYIGKGIVAVDLAGSEDFPPEIHKEAFQLAHKLGYHITVHAGETGISENIVKSIELLKAERIGHGIAAAKDPKVMKLIKEKEVFLEMCPISNLQTKAINNIEDYPIMDFMNKGLKVTVNTDNTTVSNTTLEREYELLIDKLNFTLEDIVVLVLNSVEAAFINKKEKEILSEIIKKEIEVLY